jgi:hypothetical protein
VLPETPILAAALSRDGFRLTGRRTDPLPGSLPIDAFEVILVLALIASYLADDLDVHGINDVVAVHARAATDDACRVHIAVLATGNREPIGQVVRGRDRQRHRERRDSRGYCACDTERSCYAFANHHLLPMFAD